MRLFVKVAGQGGRGQSGEVFCWSNEAEETDASKIFTLVLKYGVCVRARSDAAWIREDVWGYNELKW